MRKFLFCFALFVVACSSNSGDEVDYPGKHVPDITALALSPSTVTFADGDGNVTISAEITFRDPGGDIQTLSVKMPDGSINEFNESINGEQGTFTEEFTMPTETVGMFAIEFWLEDEVGDISRHRFTSVKVVWDDPESDWTSRLGGLPYVLNDVAWDGDVFIAVGDGGAILTSTNGTDWAAKESATEGNLYAVAAYGPDIFVVGDGIVLRSTDHGETWIAKGAFDGVSLGSVVVTSSQVVVSGSVPALAAGYTAVSEDRGDTWQGSGWFDPNPIVVDLVYADDLFVAIDGMSSPTSESWLAISADGDTWNRVTACEDCAALYTIIHDGSQFIVAGNYSTVLASFDAFNWTELQTPVKDVQYMSAASNGSKLLLAGGMRVQHWSGDGIPQIELPVGIASTDGGATWDIFNIDGYYQSRGIAFGEGRFVSVGQSTPISGEGAIYVTD